MSRFGFRIEKAAAGSLARAGVLETPHGDIRTPAFVPVATKATVKALTPVQVKDMGAQVVLANTYHLYLQPGPKMLTGAGGLSKFMGWPGPTMTDSGGFQVFSLGAAFGKRLSKFGKKEKESNETASASEEAVGKLADVDEEGVTFRSHRDGSEHRFTPERSMQIQHDIGADIIFAFDECPSPEAAQTYQREAMERTHRWAQRSLSEHRKLGGEQALFGIVQGGRFEDLRRESAQVIGGMEFDGFGIGGSFSKEDMGNAVRWVNEILPPEKPRHLLGIGDPGDMLEAIEQGCDTFDCVAPTREGRTGGVYTAEGRMNIKNSRFASEFAPIESDCDCYTCKTFTRAYLHHLFDANEMLAATLSSIHNLRFVIRLVDHAREAVFVGNIRDFKEDFLSRYGHGRV